VSARFLDRCNKLQITRRNRRPEEKSNLICLLCRPVEDEDEDGMVEEVNDDLEVEEEEEEEEEEEKKETATPWTGLKTLPVSRLVPHHASLGIFSVLHLCMHGIQYF
jgi:hypothetical protein